MADRISSRQNQILELLLNNKAGLSIGEIGSALKISRNAVQQHFSKLERDNYIQAGVLKKTAGRPVQTFVLTETGINSFPKQYAWFSELILTDLEQELGSDAFKIFLKKMGNSLAQKLMPDFADKSIRERVDILINTMNDLGYQAKLAEDMENNTLGIEACNCVYHNIAQKHQEICEFDKAFITSLLDTDIELVECMAKGGHSCKFTIK